MNFSLRKLTRDAADVELTKQLLRIFHEAFAEEESQCDVRLPSESYLTQMLTRNDFHAVVALGDNTVIGGFTAYEMQLLPKEETELFLYDIAVATSHRRRGVGTTLVRFAEKLCEERGHSALYVPAHVDDAPAVRFYESLGLKREEVAWFTREFPPDRQAEPKASLQT